jgi:hypothetical protein
MEIDKVFNDDVDGVADNLFSAVNNSISEIKVMQQRKAAENVQLVIQALKKIDSDIRSRYDNVGNTLEKRVSSIKDGRDGSNGKDGRDGKDGKNGRDGAKGDRGERGQDGVNGVDGNDGVSVTNASIDFDGSLIITLSTGRELNVGEVVAPDLAERIKVITNGGGTSQSVLDTLTSLQSQITGLLSVPVVIEGTTTSAALRVTQLGTGDAFVVEDSTNPDSTPFVINASGNLLIGTTSTILGGFTSTTPTITSVGSAYTFANYTATAAGVFLQGVKGRGTSASPTTTQSGDNILTISGSGYDSGNVIRDMAAIQVVSAGAATASGVPAFMRFYTNDGTTNAERMRIDSSGNVGIGTTSISAVSNYKVLDLSGTDGGFIGLAVAGTRYGSIYGDVNGVTVQGQVSGGYIRFNTNSGVGPAERVRVDSVGNVQVQAGAVMPYAPAPAGIAAATTLTNANIQAQIISATGTTYTITMPLGTTLETLATWATTGIAYDFYVVNTASGVITMAVNTGVTSLGSLTIAIGASAHFRIRRTAASTFVLYRLN